MRAVFTSIMAVALIAALFWGNCFSCPQLLLAQQKHGCCPHGKDTRFDCTTQALKNFVQAEKGSAVAPVAVAWIWHSDLLDRDAVTADGPRPLIFTTPPLHTSLRI